MFFATPESVTEFANVTAVTLALIVRFALGFPGLGGLAASAGPAHARADTSSAPIFFMYLKRGSCGPGWVPEQKRAPVGALFAGGIRTRLGGRVRGRGAAARCRGAAACR